MVADFKVEGSGVDAAALEAELAERVAARRRSGAFSPEVEALLAERLPDEEAYGTLPPVAELDYATRRAQASWCVSAAYPVETEKSALARPFIIFAKRLARLWARVAVGPIQREQTAFNRHAAAALEALRRHAVAERAEALAAEDDLSQLAGALMDEGEAAASTSTVAEFLGGGGTLTVVGPCPSPVLEALSASGLEVFVVSPGTAWDESSAGAAPSSPVSFLAQLAEESTPALLVSELAFWLTPEALVRLARRSYLVLAKRGRIAVTVHGFATGGPAPAWCAPAAVKKALSLAGFTDIAVSRPLDKGYVATARRP